MQNLKTIPCHLLKTQLFRKFSLKNTCLCDYHKFVRLFDFSLCLNVNVVLNDSIFDLMLQETTSNVYLVMEVRFILNKAPVKKIKPLQVYRNLCEKRIKSEINPFLALVVSSYTPWKHHKTSWFSMFLGGIEREQWYEMG